MEKPVFSQTLQTLRKEKKVTQEQLANHLGVSAQAVSKWENGSYPEGDLIPAIAEFFKVSIDYLYGKGGKAMSTEEAVFKSLRDNCIKEFEETQNPKKHEGLADTVRKIHWAVQNAPWVNNEEYYNPPCYGIDSPKMSSVFVDESSYSYMGLREDNNFYVWLKQDEEKDIFEKLLSDPERICDVFKIMSDKDNMRILTYLYSLSSGEFAGADTIAKALKLSKEKVDKTLNEIVSKIGYQYGQNAPFKTVKIVEDEKEKTAYGTDPVFGGLFMAITMMIKEYADTPSGFQMMICNKEKSWVDRKKINKQ
jgi:transcriptional regulator with XRE-family HTH domain